MSGDVVTAAREAGLLPPGNRWVMYPDERTIALRVGDDGGDEEGVAGIVRLTLDDTGVPRAGIYLVDPYTNQARATSAGLRHVAACLQQAADMMDAISES